MNIRLIIIIFIITVFAVGTGWLSYSQLAGVPLTQAFDEGHVSITQITSAGTVPHQVSVNNTGTKPIKISIGDVLMSSSSQNLVVAENSTLSPNSTAVVKAYCLEPAKAAVAGATFNGVDMSSDAIKEVIYNSNPDNLQNATTTQLEIWILSSGTNFSVYQGEPVALVYQQQTSYYQLKQQIIYAKSLIEAEFNITADQIDSYNQNTTNQNSLENIYNSIKSL